MGSYLIVFNGTTGGDQLMTEVRRLIAKEPSSFFVLVPVPASESQRPGFVETMATGEAKLMVREADLPSHLDREREALERQSRRHLEHLTREIRAAGGEADGDLGDSDPLKAIEHEVRVRLFDEIDHLDAALGSVEVAPSRSDASRRAPVRAPGEERDLGGVDLPWLEVEPQGRAGHRRSRSPKPRSERETWRRGPSRKTTRQVPDELDGSVVRRPYWFLWRFLPFAPVRRPEWPVGGPQRLIESVLESTEQATHGIEEGSHRRSLDRAAWHRRPPNPAYAACAMDRWL